MCEHCDHIRQTTDMILGLTFMNWPMASVAQAAAYIQARVRFEAAKHGEKEEKEYIDWFNGLCDTEFKELNFRNPQEPAKFDDKFDFREQMKNGE